MSLDFIKKKNLRDLLRSNIEIKTIDGSIENLPPISITKEAFDSLIDKMNLHLNEQLSLLRFYMPRYTKGNKKNKIKKKTIDLSYLESSEFPKIDKINGDLLKDTILKNKLTD